MEIIESLSRRTTRTIRFFFSEKVDTTVEVLVVHIILGYPTGTCLEPKIDGFPSPPDKINDAIICILVRSSICSLPIHLFVHSLIPVWFHSGILLV